MTSSQVKRGFRGQAILVAAALATTLAVAGGDLPAHAATTPSLAQGAVVAPSSTVKITGGVGLTDDAVYGESANGIVTLPRTDLGGEWAPVAAGGAPLTGHLLQAEGDALLVADPDGTADTLAWRADDGPWSTRSVPNGTTLGRGGLYALLPPVPTSDGDGQSWPVQDVATGQTVTSRLWWGPLAIAVDGPSLWTASTALGSIVQRSLPAGTETREVPEPGVVDPAALTVSGRWAMLSGAVARVIDIDDVYADLDLGAPSTLHDLVLGARTSAWVTSAGTVAVRELAGTRGTRTYGPARRTTRALDIDVDDAGSTLAYVGTDGLARLVDLGWATARATAIVDHAAPPVPAIYWSKQRSAASPVISVGTLLTGGDAASAPYRASGADVQIRYHQHKTGANTFGPWVTVPQWSLTLTAPRATTTCFEARAHDEAGNYSAWSGAICTVVDGTAPRLTVHGPASATKAVHGKAAVKVSYEATDDVRVASYDVRYKKAPKGTTSYGAWTYPASWQKTAAVSKSLSITTGQRVCLSVRARDSAGNASAWSSPRCTFADGTKPHLTKVTGPPRWRGVPKSGKVRSTITFSGKDDHGLRFDVRVRKATITGRLGSWTTVVARTTKRSYTNTLTSGQEACYEVRAHDTAGNVGAWSTLRCTNVAAPATSKYLHADHLTTVGGVRVAGVKDYLPGDRHGTSWGAGIFQSGAKGVRLQVRTCATCGTFRVQVEDKLMTVKTTSKKPGWKYVTLTWKRDDGRVDFFGFIPYPHPKVTKAYIRSWTLLR